MTAPTGLNTQDKTTHRNRKPSWASLEAEASSGHDEESGALTGSLSNRFHFCDRRGRRLGLASMATTRGPRRVSMDKTRQVKMFLWAQQDINTALLAVTCGLDPRDLGWSQRRLAGLPHALQAGLPHELQVGLPHALQAGLPHELQAGLPAACLGKLRTAASISHERRAWGSRGRRRRSSHERRAWRSHRQQRTCGIRGQRTHDTRGDPAELPRCLRGLWRKDEWRLPCRGTDKHRNKQKTLKN